MKQFTLKSLLLMLTIFLGGVNAWGQDNQVLFHESFGNNSSSARAWDDSYSVKTGIEAVFSGVSGYTVVNVKQGKNTTGQNQSGLNQSTMNVDASIIIGPLNTADCSNMELSYYWKAASIKGSYSTTAYYSTSSDGEYTLIGEGSNGATSFVLQKFNMPEEAQVSTLYLKIVWNTSNTQAIIDEVDLSGVYTSDPSTPVKPATPDFSLPSGKVYGTQTLKLTTTVENGIILYTIDGSDPTTSETAVVYSAPLTISETTTVMACVKDAEGKFSNVAERTYTFVPSIANTPETAYTVAKAIELIDETSAEQLAAEKVYVKGVVSKVDSYNSTYKSITYWLDNNTFQVYSGKGLDNADFYAQTDIEVGATVIVYGNVKKYKTTYEFDKENHLVTYTAPERLPATDGTSNYATFSSDKNVEFVDATVYAVNVQNNVLQLNEVTSKQVPAGTGVLIKSENETAPYFYIDEAAAIENNLLKPASEKMSGSYTFYKLAYNDYTNQTGLGFYWGAEDGGAFNVKAGTAYLAVPNALSVKGFLLDGTPTAIEGVEAESTTGVIYNLSGQRVQKAQHGLYIVNGKKLLVK